MVDQPVASSETESSRFAWLGCASSSSSSDMVFNDDEKPEHAGKDLLDRDSTTSH
jgi:hypothetical protein